MNNEESIYRYVGIDNLAMHFAYMRAKELYMHRRWNKKTTPVAVIMKNNEPISWAASANGAHAIEGKCYRLNKRGSDYSECGWCSEDNHAEQIALRRAKEQNQSVHGCDLYLYGHWHMCETCRKALKEAGIENLFLLENAAVLFDRHHPKTVIGKEEQFKL